MLARGWWVGEVGYCRCAEEVAMVGLHTAENPFDRPFCDSRLTALAFPKLRYVRYVVSGCIY